MTFGKLFIRSFQFHDVFHLDNENGAEDMPTLIDRKVCPVHATVVYIVHRSNEEFLVIL